MTAEAAIGDEPDDEERRLHREVLQRQEEEWWRFYWESIQYQDQDCGEEEPPSPETWLTRDITAEIERLRNNQRRIIDELRAQGYSLSQGLELHAVFAAATAERRADATVIAPLFFLLGCLMERIHFLTDHALRNEIRAAASRSGNSKITAAAKARDATIREHVAILLQEDAEAKDLSLSALAKQLTKRLPKEKGFSAASIRRALGRFEAEVLELTEGPQFRTIGDIERRIRLILGVKSNEPGYVIETVRWLLEHD
jgi:hypothetical protein